MAHTKNLLFQSHVYNTLITLTQQQAANNRRRRSSNDSLTIFASSFCNPRFKQLEPVDNGGGSSDRYGLFWDCPAGESIPPDDIQAVLCEVLVQSGLVASCKAANMSVVTPPTRPPSLPEIRYAQQECDF